MGQELILVDDMTEADVGHVVALEEELRPRPWSAAVFHEELVAPGRAYVVARSDRILGFGGVMVVGEDAHITNIAVDPSIRRQGVGTRIMDELVRRAVRMGAVNLTLEVASRNEGAIGLYRRYGMAPVGIRKGYYGDDDALIFWAYEISAVEETTAGISVDIEVVS